MRSFIYAIAFFLTAFMAAQFAVAAAVPVSVVSDAVFEAGTAIGLVGGAVLLVFALLGALATVRSGMGVGSASALHAPGGGSYLADLEARLAAEDAANGVEWRDVGTGKSNLDYEREALAPTYREATIEESASWQRVNDAADAGESAAYEAGLHGLAVDKAGWTTEQHIAFDGGKDQAHENYLATLGTSSASNKALRGKD
jgi:hypothetical protein